MRLVIVHTAEGATTYKSLGSYFQNPSAGVSSHVGIDDTPGRLGEYVKRGNKAWTAGDANPISVNAELCGFAKWSPAEWERHPEMLDTCARWIAEECRQYGIPIVKSNQHGVCGHVDVSGPGGHWDPGPDFPWSKVLAAAKSGGPVYGSGPATPAEAWHLPLAARANGDDMPPEYICHTTHPDAQGSGGYFACYASGLVRRIGEDEKQWIRAQAGFPNVIQVDQADPGTRLHQMDEALRGMKN